MDWSRGVRSIGGCVPSAGTERDVLPAVKLALHPCLDLLTALGMVQSLEEIMPVNMLVIKYAKGHRPKSGGPQRQSR